EQHKVIAEKLLEVETLDERAIKSLFETGEMPDSYTDAEVEFPREEEDAAGSSFEEIKRAREAKEKHREKQLESSSDFHASSEDDSEENEGKETSSTVEHEELRVKGNNQDTVEKGNNDSSNSEEKPK